LKSFSVSEDNMAKFQQHYSVKLVDFKAEMIQRLMNFKTSAVEQYIFGIESECLSIRSHDNIKKAVETAYNLSDGDNNLISDCDNNLISAGDDSQKKVPLVESVEWVERSLYEHFQLVKESPQNFPETNSPEVLKSEDKPEPGSIESRYTCPILLT